MRADPLELPGRSARRRMPLPGSGWDAAQRVLWWMGAWFVANGVGAFLYDPRFTGGTGDGNVHGYSTFGLVSVDRFGSVAHLIEAAVVAGAGIRAAHLIPQRWRRCEYVTGAVVHSAQRRRHDLRDQRTRRGDVLLRQLHLMP